MNDSNDTENAGASGVDSSDLLEFLDSMRIEESKAAGRFASARCYGQMSTRRNNAAFLEDTIIPKVKEFLSSNAEMDRGVSR